MGRVALVTGLAAASLPSAAPGSTISTDTTADEFGTGKRCSLREAIQAATTDAAFGGCDRGDGADSVELPGGSFTLTRPGVGEDSNATGDLDVASGGGRLEIRSSGIEQTSIDASRLDRVLHLLPGSDLTLSGISIQNGAASGTATPNGESAGGGILNEDGVLAINDAAILDNTAAYAAGIQNFGYAALTNVTIAGNEATTDSGGFDNFFDGSAVLNNVTVTANVADSNSNGGNGGGIGHYCTGTLTISNSIVAGNFDLSLNPGGAAPDCYGPIVSAGHNLIGDATNCTYASAGGDILGTDGGLASAGAFGGPAMTSPLAPDSSALDMGSPAGPGSSQAACASADARGVPRPQRGRCDIGAYEAAECRGELVDVVGTGGADELVGTSETNAFLALGGRDVLRGKGGDDRLCGGNGRDTCRGGGGRDKVKSCERRKGVP